MWMAAGEGRFGCFVSLVVAMDAAVGFDFLEKGGEIFPDLPGVLFDGKGRGRWIFSSFEAGSLIALSLRCRLVRLSVRREGGRSS